MKVHIERWLYGGAGQGIGEDGQSIALPFTLPGETVETSGTDTSGSDLLAVRAPSPDRVAPPCPHFGPCGGCQYQHAAYDTQTRLKRGILEDTIHAAGLTALPPISLHTAEPWGYRNRIRLRLAAADGALRAGYNRRGTNDFLPIVQCPISTPLLLTTANALLSVLAATPALTAWAGELHEAELFTNADQTQLQMTLFARSDRHNLLPLLCTRLKALIPELRGASVILTGPSGKREQPGATWGAPGITYQAAGRSYWVAQGSFFQVNRFLIDTLVHLATGGRTGQLAWDLYAGVGLFSRALLDSFTQVVGVEIAGHELATVLKPPQGRAVAATTLDFLQRAVLERDRPGLIVVDPPRAGLGAEVCALLARIAAPQVVYVSCDPMTLARDLAAMVDSGYTLDELHLVDLFPQTFHLETVAILKR